MGFLAHDPQLKYTPSGIAVTNFRIGSTPYKYDSVNNTYIDKETLWITCNAWRKLAENICESLYAGDRVIVHGRMVARNWVDGNNQKRTSFELEAEDVGASFKFVRGYVERNPKKKT